MNCELLSGGSRDSPVTLIYKGGSRMKTDNPLKLIIRLVEKFIDEKFYGEIVIKFENGKAVRIVETKNHKIKVTND